MVNSLDKLEKAIEPIIEEKKNLPIPITKKVVKLSELLEKGIPKISWLVENIVREGGITIIGGTSGTMKTFFALELALACVSGNQFLDYFDVQKTKVLYVDEENGDIVIFNRLSSMTKSNNIKSEDLDKFFLLIYEGLKLDNDEIILSLTKVIEEFKPKLIIFDSLVRFFEGDEDKSKDVRRIFDNLKPFVKEYQVSFIILHHTTKNGKGLTGLRGSGDISAFADVVLMFDKKKSGIVNVEIAKNRHIDTTLLSSFNFKPESSDETFYLKFMEINVEDVTERDKCISDLKEWWDENSLVEFKSGQAKKVMEENGYSKNTYYAAINKLILEEMVQKGDKKGYYKINSYQVIEEEHI